MAGNAVIGALRVVLGADTASLDKGLNDARSNVASFAADIARTGAIIGAAIATAYTAVSVGVSNTLASMDQLNKQSQKIGIPVEQLSALRLAADLSDVSMEQLGNSVGKLAKNMVSAASAPTSEAANAFRALGVSVKDSNGQLLPTQEVLLSVADKMSGLKDGAGKTAAAMAIFGRAGAEIIPFLNSGRDGIEGMIASAQKFGIVIDTDTGKAAEKFRDTLTMVSAAKDGLIVKLTAFLLPALQQFADRMLSAATNADKQEQKLSFLKTAFEGLARVVLLVADNFKLVLQLGAAFAAAQIASMVINMGVAFFGLARAIQATGLVMAAVEALRAISMKGWLLLAGVIIVATGNFGAFKDKLSEVATFVASAMPESSGALGTALKGLGIDLSALSSDLATYKGHIDGASKSQKDFNFSALGGKNAIDQLITSQNKHVDTQNAEIATFNMLPGQMEATKLQMQALTVATANHTSITAAQQIQLDITKQKLIETGQTLAALQLVQSNLTPSQLLQQEQLKIQTLFDNGKLSAEAYGQAMQKVAENANATWDLAGASIAGSFAQISSSFSKESSAMATAAKVFGIIQGTISMFTGAAKALELPFPANIAAVAAVLAKGAALVASIRGQTVPTGMMTGGSMTVRGGGGPDTTPVQIMASPGEQIDVWRPDQGGGADPRRGAGGGNTVNLSMPIATTRDALAEIIRGLNGMFADGYRLNVVPA